MYKSKRKLFSAASMAMMLAFLFITPVTATACGEEPQSLLSLYLQSDLIVLAEHDGSRVLKTESEDEYGSWVETAYDLRVIKVLKGPDGLETVLFTSHDFHPKPDENMPATDEMVGEHEPYEDYYVDLNAIRPGDKHLYFLVKNEESGDYTLTDYASAVKDVSGKYEIYEKSINGLREISASKDNQMEMLAEWLVSSIEEPETRDDAMGDLAEAFFSLIYDEETEDADVAPDGTAVIKEADLKFDESFNLYSSNIAAKLTDSQKYRISTVFYQRLQEAWFAPEPEYAGFGIGVILASFDRAGIAMYAYNMYSNVDSADSERKQIIMAFLTEVVEDENLSNLYTEFVNLDYEFESEEEKTEELSKVIAARKARLLDKFNRRFETLMAGNFGALGPVA